jgi:ribosome biogenesis protein Nip4
MTQDLTLFHKFTQQFTNTEMTDIRRIGRNFFQAEERLWEIKNGVNRDIYSLGLHLGEEKMGFSPSPALVDLISKFPDAESKKIFVNKKAEWMFLCGRNILSSSISKNPNRLSEGLVLVQNEHDENLGYGLFKKEDTLIIKHVLDKGRYLRIDEKGHNKRAGQSSKKSGKGKFHDASSF